MGKNRFIKTFYTMGKNFIEKGNGFVRCFNKIFKTIPVPE